jgi:hypothetical protein
VIDVGTVLFLKRDTPSDDWTVDKMPVRFEGDLANSARTKAVRAGENWVARSPDLHHYELATF